MKNLDRLIAASVSRVLALLLLSVLFAGVVTAQPTPPTSPEAPLDGGLALLLGAGAATAAIRYGRRRRGVDQKNA